MEILYRCCGGLDVHKETVVACLLSQQEGQVKKEVRTFGTMTASASVLVGLADLLRLHPRGHGVYGGVLEADL